MMLIGFKSILRFIDEFAPRLFSDLKVDCDVSSFLNVSWIIFAVFLPSHCFTAFTVSTSPAQQNSLPSVHF